MQIEVLYFEGCPTHRETVELVRETVDRLELDAETADIAEINVETEEQARQMEFIGSPTVRVDGEDIEPGAHEDTTAGRRCRVYATADGLSGTPPAAMLEAALRGESYEAGIQNGEEESAERDCCASNSRPSVQLLVADWCPQCPAAKTFWKNLRDEAAFDLEIIDVESERGGKLAAEHGVSAVPSTIVEGELMFRQTPVPSRADAVEAIEETSPGE